MQRNRSKPHYFEGQIAAEKARLEEQIANLPHGPEKDRLRKKDPPARYGCPHERLASIAWSKAT